MEVKTGGHSRATLPAHKAPQPHMTSLLSPQRPMAWPGWGAGPPSPLLLLPPEMGEILVNFLSGTLDHGPVPVLLPGAHRPPHPDLFNKFPFMLAEAVGVQEGERWATGPCLPRNLTAWLGSPPASETLCDLGLKQFLQMQNGNSQEGILGEPDPQSPSSRDSMCL